MSRPHPNPEGNDMSSYTRAARRAAAWASRRPT